MKLSKLFGLNRREQDSDAGEEPARFVAPPPRETAQLEAKKRSDTKSLGVPNKASSGFDPYNSGTFKKKDNAWERVGRR